MRLHFVLTLFVFFSCCFDESIVFAAGQLSSDKVIKTQKTPASPHQKMLDAVQPTKKNAFSGGELQPIVPAKGVHPVGELEVLEALKDPSFKVVDMRSKKWRVQATIKGSIHIPYTEIAQRLNELGCVSKEGKWECSNATKVVAFCNGATCKQSPTAIKIMIAEGYPADRIYYYRGGIQSWILRWLTVTEKEGH